MKRTCFYILLVSSLGLFIAPTAQAAPVAPELQVSITPPDGTVMPGQLVLVYAGGGFPLEVQGTLDGESLTFFWSGDGYVAPIAFDLETPPGTHQLVVTAVEPGGGRTTDFQATLTVKEDTYLEEYINIGGPLADLLDPAINQAETDRLAELVSPVSHRLEWDWPFAFPVISKVTSLFGSHRTYNFDQLTGRHTGIDFRMAVGVSIYAAAAGRVVAAEPFDVRGNVVIIDHGWGVYTLYAHLSEFRVSVGEEVTQGQLIGEAGQTGRSTASHLHWEVIVNGKSVDPLVWMALSSNYIPPAIDEGAEAGASVE